MVEEQGLKGRADAVCVNDSVTHGSVSDLIVRPNDEKERGRVKAVEECACGHRESGFGNVTITAQRMAGRRMLKHVFTETHRREDVRADV
jgi:hypothetical protein